MSDTNNTATHVEGAASQIPMTGVLEQNGESASIDAIFDALKRQRRRYIVYYLHQQGDRSVDELAQLIAASENGGDPDQVSGETTMEIHLGLRHVHLPKLVATNIITYDQEKQQVHLNDNIASLRPYLNLTATTELE